MKLSAFILLLLIAAPAFRAQAPETKTFNDGLPDSTIGTILREWFAAVNSGDSAQIRKFVDSRFSANAFRYQRSADQYAAFFNKLYGQSGGLKIVTVFPHRPPQPIAVLAKSKRGGRYIRVLAGLDDAENGKLFGMGAERARSPNAKKLGDIAEPMSESDMIVAIERQLDGLAAEGDLSGVILIARDDRILIERAFGMADREAKIPNTLDTKFGIASVGKMFTAVAITQLAEAGKLSFDDTVEKVLPDYPNKDVGSRVTIKQLLTHSAGMGTFFESPGFVMGKEFPNTTAEIEVYKDEKLFFEPGTRWRYSNAGYSLLGAIIERLSSKTYLEYIRENIFKPLGMRDTYTNSPGKAAPNSSVFYTQSDNDPLGLESYIADRNFAAAMASSFGGCCSTARNMFRFLRAYRTGQLLGPQMTDALFSYKVNTSPKETQRYAYGAFETDFNGEIVRGHSGGSRVDVRMLWNSGYTVIVMTNQFPPVASTISSDIVNFITRQNALHKK
jgi:CubicO group peptidase (beta-lactamase class C family)